METFLDAELEKLGAGQTVFMGSLDLKDSKKLAENLSPFLKQIFEIWPELSYQVSTETAEPFLTQNLWHNYLIIIMDKPVFYKLSTKKGIPYVNQLLRNNQRLQFLSPKEFESNLKV